MVLNKNDDILSIIKKEIAYVQSFEPTADFEIEIGASLLVDLGSYTTRTFDKQLYLFDIPVRINFEKEVFNIWKKIL